MPNINHPKEDIEQLTLDDIQTYYLKEKRLATWEYEWLPTRFQESPTPYLLTFNNEHDFQKLIHPYIRNGHMFLNKKWGHSCATTIKQFNLNIMSYNVNWQNLMDHSLKGPYDSNWFSPNPPLEKDFDYNKFTWPILYEPSLQERLECPEGNFRILDGLHRCQVLSRLLLENKIQFQPVQAVLITPRPSELRRGVKDQIAAIKKWFK